jgi:hypothetical protein
LEVFSIIVGQFFEFLKNCQFGFRKISKAKELLIPVLPKTSKRINGFHERTTGLRKSAILWLLKTAVVYQIRLFKY